MGGTCRICRCDGQCVTLIVNRLPVKDDAGNTLGFVSQSLIADTDELKGLAEKISQLDHKVAFYRRRMQSALSAIHSLQNILGRSQAVLKVKEKLSLYAKTESPVLILGATGTGKELFAQRPAPGKPPGRGPVREHQLRRHTAGAFRVRAVRLRGRIVFRGAQGGQGRPDRAGRQRNPLSRRDRGHALADPGQALAGYRGQERLPPGINHPP